MWIIVQSFIFPFEKVFVFCFGFASHFHGPYHGQNQRLGALSVTSFFFYHVGFCLLGMEGEGGEERWRERKVTIVC